MKFFPMMFAAIAIFAAACTNPNPEQHGTQGNPPSAGPGALTLFTAPEQDTQSSQEFGVIAPTAGGLAEYLTLARVREALGWADLHYLFPSEAAKLKANTCADTLEFLDALYQTAYGDGEESCANETGVINTLARVYRVRRAGFCDMGGWDVVWYRSAKRLVPEYLIHCTPERSRSMRFGQTTLSCADGVSCDRSVEEQMRTAYGKAVFTGLNDPLVAAGVLRDVGMKGRPRAGYEAIRFEEYGETVWRHVLVLMDGPNKSPQDEITFAMRYLPFVVGSWSDAVNPVLHHYACHSLIPQVRREELLRTVHERLTVSGFWKGHPSAHALPKTLAELCAESPYGSAVDVGADIIQHETPVRDVPEVPGESREGE